MKDRVAAGKANRTARGGAARQSSAGESAVALAPPDYGIEFVDRAMDAGAAAGVPSIVHAALRSPGRPLDAAAYRTGFDFSKLSAAAPRRGAGLTLGSAGDASEREAESVAASPARAAASTPDFSAVRVHTGAAPAAAAAALDAAAFTVGDDIVFGAGRYDPVSRAGRGLIAHELAHVVQDGAGVLRRRGLGDKALVFFGLSEGDFDEKELVDYLAAVTTTGKIEDNYDSDNKARAIVRRWMLGFANYHLTARQMVLLIREMDTGWVGSEDQEGIFNLLTHAENGDLRHIFAAGRIDPKALADDFGGARKQRLISFYEARFRGGKAALYGGVVDPLGGPGAGTPVFVWDLSFFRGKLADPGYRDDELAAELSRLTDPERDRALKDISGERVLLQRASTEALEKAAAEPDPVKKADLQTAARDLARKRQRADQVMQVAFRDIAVAEAPAVLLPKTRLPAAAEKVEIGKALKPDVHMVGGVPLPFERQILGEVKKYDDKIRDMMAPMIQGYWDDMVKDKEAAQHADPAKVHKLDEFDSIANAAKEATDRVFGGYKTGPAFRSDTVLVRGQLHDLFADTEAQLGAMTAPQKKRMAKALVNYFFQSNDDVAALNAHHNADPQFTALGAPANPEAVLLDGIATAWVAAPAHVKQLNEIDRNWDASADPSTHEVNIQIFKKPTVPEDRRFFWDMYQTLIHEYLHTLVHPLYNTFADSFGASSLQNNTLMEGVDSFLTEIAWADAKTRVESPAVRAKVEGPAYAGLPFDASLVPQVYGRRYGSYTQAVKLVNVVGVRNLYAAYFLGRTDLIKP